MCYGNMNPNDTIYIKTTLNGWKIDSILNEVLLNQSEVLQAFLNE